jgi:hypothetical protein
MWSPTERGAGPRLSTATQVVAIVSAMLGIAAILFEQLAV